MTYVYVMSGGRRHVKIGHSKNVEARRAGVQTGCPFTVKIAAQWYSTRAHQIENQAHRLLGKYRWAGEWFDVPARAATLAVGMLITSQPSFQGKARKPVSKAIAFCRSCAHSAVMCEIPPIDAKLRCSKCSSRDHVHVVDIVVSEPV